MKIGSAVLLIGMIIFLWPSAKNMMTNSPAAEKGDWQGVILPLLAVAGFVAFLIWSV